MISALLAVGLYAVTLGGTYIYDDIEIARDDERLREPGAWVKYFREPYFVGAPDSLWRPLPCLTYVIHHRLHGETAWPLHAVNVLLHAIVSGLVAELGRRMTGSIRVALFAGVLFAAHPVHVEAVAMIVGRAELICAIGVVGGLVIFLGRQLTMARVAGIAACFVLAVMSKEHGLLLAPMLLAVHLARKWLGNKQVEGRERQAHLVLLGTMCLLIFAYTSYRESIMPLFYDRWFMRWSVNPVVRARGLDRIGVPLEILGRYVELLLWPAKLSVDYGADVTTWVTRWHGGYVYVGMGAVAAYGLGVAAAIRKRSAEALACLLCLGLAYALISNLVLVIGTAMGERLIYLGSVFFVLVLAIGMARLPKRLGRVALVVLVGLGAVRTATYAARFNDPLELYANGRLDQPRSVMLHVLEAEQRIARGELEEAERIMANARVLAPDAQNAWAWSAEVARKQGKIDEAQRFESRAFELGENPPHMPERKSRPWREGASRPVR